MGDKSGSNKMTQKIGEKVNEISAKAYNIIPDRIKKSTAFSFIEKEMGSHSDISPAMGSHNSAMEP